MKQSKRTHILAITFSILSIVWVSSAARLLPVSAGSIEERIRARLESRSGNHEAAPASQSGKNPMTISVRGPEQLPLNGTVNFNLTATNNLPFAANDVRIEHSFQAQGYDAGDAFLVLIPERSDKRCTASKNGAVCDMQGVAPSSKASLRIAYRVVRCVPGFSSRSIVIIKKTTATMGKGTTGIVTGCSPSDRSI